MLGTKEKEGRGEGMGVEEGKEGIADGGRDMRGGKEGKEGRRRSMG